MESPVIPITRQNTNTDMKISISTWRGCLYNDYVMKLMLVNSAEYFEVGRICLIVCSTALEWCVTLSRMYFSRLNFQPVWKSFVHPTHNERLDHWSVALVCEVKYDFYANYPYPPSGQRREKKRSLLLRKEI